MVDTHLVIELPPQIAFNDESAFLDLLHDTNLKKSLFL